MCKRTPRHGYRKRSDVAARRRCAEEWPVNGLTKNNHCSVSCKLAQTGIVYCYE